MHMIKFNDIWEQKLFPLFIVRGWKYRRGGENIVTIFSPRGEDIMGVKISSHTATLCTVHLWSILIDLEGFLPPEHPNYHTERLH